MKSFKYHGTFKGQDGSLGYRTGERYELDIGLGTYQGKPVYWLSKYNNAGSAKCQCPYSSARSLKANWDIEEELFIVTTDPKDF